MSITLERVTKIPSLCKHCHKYTSNPPKWVEILGVMAGGKGHEVYLTATGAAVTLKVSRQAASNLMQTARREGAVEPVSSGSNTYRKTRYGTEIYSRWIRSGWKPEVKRR